MLRIFVTGSRNWTDRNRLYTAIEAVCKARGHWNPLNDTAKDVTIVHGAAKGADTLADDWAKTFLAEREPYPADWEQYGKAAGPMRNTLMAKSHPDVCLAFLQPGSVGTVHAIKQAKKYDVEVIIHEAV